MNQSNKQDDGEYGTSVPNILRNAADQLDVPTTGLAAIRRQGETHQHRRRAAIASMSAVLLVATGVFAVQQLSTTRDRSTAPATAPADAAPDSTTTGSGVPVVVPDGVPVTRVEPLFVWNKVVPGSAEAIGNLVFGIGVTDEAPYLAWSTAPGSNANGDYVPVLYRSDDGIHWTPAPDSTFTEPDVSRYGLAVQGDTMFAFGTAAATAAIPKGGAGDAVVDISTDRGASWDHQVLPIDLRGLAAIDGVESVGLSGGMAAANGVIVVVAQPTVIWDAQTQSLNQGDGELAITSHGAYTISYPERDANGTFPPTTVTEGATADATDDTLPIISDLIPLSDLGIDPASVDAARTPRAFFSTDGATFTEATFPPPSDNVNPTGGNEMSVFASGGHFYVTFFVSTYDPSLPYGYDYGQLVYRSIDGVTWEQVGDLASGDRLLGVLPDGTMVARSYTATASSGISTSVDGVTWVVHDLRPLIEPSDGEIVIIDPWSVAVGNQGITAFGNVMNDPIAEEGGRAIERDGVRLEVQSSLDGQLRAYDIESGDQFPDERLRYMNNGGLDVVADDGSLLASFASDEWQQLQNSQEGLLFTKVLLHSDDGQSWSRENLADLTGSNDANPGFFQQLDDKVLINLIDPSQRTDNLATTFVLVGTRK